VPYGEGLRVTQATSLDAVLFDWRGTLVHDPPHEWWVHRALSRAGRAADDAIVHEVSDDLRRAADQPRGLDRLLPLFA
jgi:hypothetical protein